MAEAYRSLNPVSTNVMIRSKLFSLTIIFAPLLMTHVGSGDEVDFNRDVRPLLSRTCFACHGPDEGARQADLRLDRRASAIEAGAIVANKSSESSLIERIFSKDVDTRMPPQESGHSLTQTEKEILKRWIDSGADYKIHWSYVPPQKSELPKTSNPQWIRKPIDNFVLAALDSKRLSPAREMDRYRWLRRVSLDLTGLPPTMEQADTFAKDQSKDAYEKVVDQLLDSPAYGERWARVWLDLARYADTKGYEKDRPRQIWRYRDWVIDALNRDLPYDQFSIEQLAGDLLKEPTTDQILATAFHRNTTSNDEGGTDDEEFRVAAVKDRVDTTLQVWMGLTAGCAKCHSHKYDPVSLEEYYSFYAFFNQTADADRYDDSPVMATPTKEQNETTKTLTSKIAQLNGQLKLLQSKGKDKREDKTAKAEEADGSDRADALKTAQESPLSDKEKSEIAELSAELKKLQDQLKRVRNSIPKTPIFRELPATKQRATTIQLRGNFLDKGKTVSPNVPEIFGKWPADLPKNRLGFSKWLFQKDNPLTARVAVNRIWARLFGIGLVETEEDFGAQGMLPTHPQLLDWLAVDFRENGWSQKRLLRKIVLSATYRQDSVVTAEKLKLDPRNRWLSRGPRFRLSSESIRDQALAVSGLLHSKIGGPSVMPTQPDGVWKSTYSNLKWVNAKGKDQFRRGLYTYWKRTSPYPSMITFDAGSGEVCQIRRIRTNTPLQALVTLNDPVYLNAAGALALEMDQVEGSLSDKIKFGFRAVLIRLPNELELKRLTELYVSLQSRAKTQDEFKLLKIPTNTKGDVPMILVASVLLNLDETLMKP